jgi:hypothetical protein
VIDYVDNDETQTAGPIVEATVTALEQTARRIETDVFGLAAIRKAVRMLRRQDGRCDAAESVAADLKTRLEIVTRQRDDAQRQLRQRAEPEPPRIAAGAARPMPVASSVVEPLALLRRQRDAARKELEDLRTTAAGEHRELESLRAQLAAITTAGDPATNGQAALPPAEAVLSARREQLTQEKVRIVADLAALALDKSPVKWQERERLVARGAAIDAELREKINPQLKRARIERQEQFVAAAQRAKGAKETP